MINHTWTFLFFVFKDFEQIGWHSLGRLVTRLTYHRARQLIGSNFISWFRAWIIFFWNPKLSVEASSLCFPFSLIIFPIFLWQFFLSQRGSPPPLPCREMPQFFSKVCVLLTWVWLACLALPAAAITPMDLGTCWNYLQQPCNCGVCSWFYQLNPPCSSQNLTMCVRCASFPFSLQSSPWSCSLGYYTGGPRQDQCCSPNVAKMVIVAVVVVSIVACWCVQT